MLQSVVIQVHALVPRDVESSEVITSVVGSCPVPSSSAAEWGQCRTLETRPCTPLALHAAPALRLDIVGALVPRNLAQDHVRLGSLVGVCGPAAYLRAERGPRAVRVDDGGLGRCQVVAWFCTVSERASEGSGAGGAGLRRGPNGAGARRGRAAAYELAWTCSKRLGGGKSGLVASALRASPASTGGPRRVVLRTSPVPVLRLRLK